MPYVIKNESGQYLRRHPHRTRNKREWVTDLDKATVWEKIGHAKAAASQALSYRSKEIEKSKATAIQEVRLMLWGAPIPHKPKRLR